MPYAPKIDNNQVYAIETQQGSLIPFGGVSGKVIGASMAGPDDMSIQYADGKTVIWNIKTGSYRTYG